MKFVVTVLVMGLGIYLLGSGLDELIAADLTTIGQLAAGFVITVLILAIALIISGL
jgi:uncharacterized membrane protein